MGCSSSYVGDTIEIKQLNVDCWRREEDHVVLDLEHETSSN